MRISDIFWQGMAVLAGVGGPEGSPLHLRVGSDGSHVSSSSHISDLCDGHEERCDTPTRDSDYNGHDEAAIREPVQNGNGSCPDLTAAEAKAERAKAEYERDLERKTRAMAKTERTIGHIEPASMEEHAHKNSSDGVQMLLEPTDRLGVLGSVNLTASSRAAERFICHHCTRVRETVSVDKAVIQFEPGLGLWDITRMPTEN